MAKAGIVYVGTEDGIVIFSDPGGTGRWRNIGHELRGRHVAALAAADALTLTVRTDVGAQHSSDGGRSWQPGEGDGPAPVGMRAATSGGAIDLPPQRIAGATAFALLGGRHPVLIAAAAGGTMIFRSEDEGIHWEPAGLNDGPIGCVTTITPAAYHIDTAWAGTVAGQLLRSDDRGRSWSLVAADLPPVRCIVAVRLA